MIKTIKPGNYAVEIKFTLDEAVTEPTLDEMFEHAMYEDFSYISESDIGEYKRVCDTEYDVCVYGYIYTVAADNENEAKSIARDMYFEETGIPTYADDKSIVWKIHGVYPYEWK